MAQRAFSGFDQQECENKDTFHKAFLIAVSLSATGILPPARQNPHGCPH